MKCSQKKQYVSLVNAPHKARSLSAWDELPIRYNSDKKSRLINFKHMGGPSPKHVSFTFYIVGVLCTMCHVLCGTCLLIYFCVRRDLFEKNLHRFKHFLGYI